jgi:TetR/AcrR family transcriptional repressor of nem operon
VPARARFTEGADRLRGSIAGLLAAMGRDDAEALAASAIAEMVGAIALARATGDGPRSDEILAASRKALKARLGIDEGTR